MDKKAKIIVGAIGAVAAIGITTGAGIAASGDDERLTGSNHDRATTVALERVGGGTVIETEMGDDGAAYEVEIRRPDGREVEVQLDANFEVIGIENDDDGGAEDDDHGEDR